ncbi:MAG TPA: 4-(cytidine 5'-diphospho)-2-C-methyl-D-erythritol kinase [Gemmatimonadota bacterium]|nr:4-(cytidine 5'-diphospho)-2-C-methyl-D-erythritol kinase [Gemmatimonadota bacterium]
MRETWLAPAKINLWLRITGRRPDGYHTLDTCYQAIDLYDTVTLEPLGPDAGEPPVACAVQGEMASGVPADEGNLAVRAARLLAAHTGHELNLSLTITKAIPAGAGLGGGSSDAAAVLLALARRFAVPDPEHTLRELALELGADVPFFLEGGTQIAGGVGERLSAVPPPPERWGILAYPGVSVSSAWAYRAFDEFPANLVERERSPDDCRERGNDLESIIFDRHSEMRRAHAILASGQAIVVRMSGSGSAIFALYASAAPRDNDLPRVRERLRDLPDAWVWPFACIDHGVRPLPDRPQTI